MTSKYILIVIITIYSHCLESLTIPVYSIIMYYLARRFEYLPQTILGIKSSVHDRHLISEDVEVNKADRYTEPSRTKMLPDVGMVKVYSECVLKAANIDWVVTLSQNTPPCS